MNREDKKENKKHCKNRHLIVKLQCWYFRNEATIKTIGLVCITSLVTHLIIIALLVLLSIALGADVSNLF